MSITARIIADSITAEGKRITTYELEYPRFIHSEFMTHRLFSRNAASSRAIPVEKAIRLILENTARPIHWGKNQPGMSAKEECNARIGDNGFGGATREQTWDAARDRAIQFAELFSKAGYHKQIVNRLLEPFSHIKVVLTTTEDVNWNWLRHHADAQPEIHELARVMIVAKEASTPTVLRPGDWHTPYYKTGFWRDSGYARNCGDGLTAIDHKLGGSSLAEALAISSSCCAQVSYRVLDDSLEKAEDIYEKLVGSEPVHASPFEHQATPIRPHDGSEFEWDSGVTHIDRKRRMWSGNFCGWIQHRQLIPNNVKME